MARCEPVRPGLAGALCLGHPTTCNGPFFLILDPVHGVRFGAAGHQSKAGKAGRVDSSGAVRLVKGKDGQATLLFRKKCACPLQWPSGHHAAKPDASGCPWGTCAWESLGAGMVASGPSGHQPRRGRPPPVEEKGKRVTSHIDFVGRSLKSMCDIPFALLSYSGTFFKYSGTFFSPAQDRRMPRMQRGLAGLQRSG